MFPPVKVINVELSHPVTDIEELSSYTGVLALVRLHGEPLGFVNVPVENGRCSAQVLRDAIVEELSLEAGRLSLRRQLLAGDPLAQGDRSPLFTAPTTLPSGPLPSVTIAVCTRDRTADLAQCLAALDNLTYPNLEILVVDNAPSDNATQTMVHTNHPNVRYIREPRPGLNWARNRALEAATGEIIAYTDDDVIVDANWVTALAQPFADDPTVMAVTGLVVPHELETDAQVLFEEYGGFGRGFQRRWCRVDQTGTHKWLYHGTGQFGTGANMAFRRAVFDHVGPFDPALDVGTVTNGGGDLEIYFRIMKEGYTLAYEPAAVVRHRHRRSYDKLKQQIHNNGVGLYSYFIRGAWAYREERRDFWRLGIWWLWWWMIRKLILSFIHPHRFPRELIWAELRGTLKGLFRYRQARKTAVQLAKTGGESLPKRPSRPRRTPPPAARGKTAVRTIDVSKPLTAVTDIEDAAQVLLHVTWQDRALGNLSIINAHQPIHKLQLADAIIAEFTPQIIALMTGRPQKRLSDYLQSELEQFMQVSPLQPQTQPAGPQNQTISIVVATFDRPEGLRTCLQNLEAQTIELPVEIVVVDNHPDSGLTPPIMAEFPDVVLVNERRQGLAYARNAGVCASTGDIIVMTDDDVIAPPGWLAQLVEPFADPNVMIVTGNVLPIELKTNAQKLFEAYGGLSRGFDPKDVDGEWFESFRLQAVPTWTLGATANAAFRADIFWHPQIGLMDAALGPGMPSGVGEDTYLFYKVLKAGYKLIYQPGAFVLHKHRQTLDSLRNQLFNYSKGHVAYHLTTFLRDGDWRALIHIGLRLPSWHFFRLLRWGIGQRDYPLRLILTELWGNVLGPWTLWQSRRRVAREGRSQQYVPPVFRPQESAAGEFAGGERNALTNLEVPNAIDAIR